VSLFDRNWHIANLDSGDEIEGDFEAQGVTRNVTAEYSEAFAVGRQEPILQFLHGNSDTISFSARVFAWHGFQDVREKLDRLIEWVRVTPGLGRPPRVLFWIGNGEISQESVISGVTDIVYDPPKWDGGVRGAAFTVSLRQYTSYNLETGDPPETRYHPAAAGDYLELLAATEYGRAELGVVLARRQPALTFPIAAGSIVKLPSLEAIRSEVIAPSSHVFAGATSKKVTAQRTLFETVLDRLNVSRTSTVL
jgi:hypothetical protein